MADRALLVAVQAFELTGCENDVELMRQVLVERGFSCTVVHTEEATRGGILAAFDDLIGATGADDAAVFYYSGHGARQLHPDWKERRAAGLPGHLQFLVPLDIDESAEDDFRGILAEELTALQRRLTDRTQNVTTILDCCHSAYMARDARLMPKSRQFSVIGAAARLRSLAPPPSPGGADTNELAVRVVACHPEQSAYERDSVPLSRRHGALTEALSLTLGEIGDRPVSWLTINDIVRRRVVADVPEQRPEVEGPSQRVPFSLRVRTRIDALPVVVDESGVFIEAASLLGVSVGDTFGLQVADADEPVATAVVQSVDQNRAMLMAEAVSPAALPPALEAVPIRTVLPPRPVRLDVTGAAFEALRAALGRSPRLSIASGDETPLATIVNEGGLVVRDGTGAPLHKGTLTDDEAGRARAIELVELLAKAERIRALPSGEGAAYLDVPVTVQLTRHDAGAPEPLPAHGSYLFRGDPISVTVRNGAHNKRVYCWLFDVGVANTVTLITNDAPSGFRLGYQGQADDGRTVGGANGMKLGWNATVPEDAPRLETFVVIIANSEQDLRALESRPAGQRGAPGSRLDAIVSEVCDGRREVPSERSTNPVRYRVEHVDFLLDPRPKPDLTEPPFALADVPHLSLRLRQPGAAAAPPARVAVRLMELGVGTGGRLAPGPIRLDALVITGTPDGGLVARPTTLRLPAMGDRGLARLPVDGHRLFRGDVDEFVDLAVWVAPDEGGEDLLRLLASAIERDDTGGGLAVSRDTITAPAASVPPIGRVATAAAVVRVAGAALETFTRGVAGVYRTSKLAFERYRLGRVPAIGRLSAGDVELAYEVAEA